MSREDRKTFLICHRCDTGTVHTLLCSAESDVKHFDADGYALHEPATYSLFRCDGCTRISVYLRSAFHSPTSDFGELEYPRDFNDLPSAPPAVRTAYRQAERVRTHSNVAYAVLARKVLETIALDRGVEERNLSRSLTVLAARGEVPPLLAEAAHHIRAFGNAAAHESDAEITELHAQMIEWFLATLVEYVYSAPAALRQFKAMLDLESGE
jgi:hypothetical protein